jgi:hypothetical protein
MCGNVLVALLAVASTIAIAVAVALIVVVAVALFEICFVFFSRKGFAFECRSL